MNAALATPDPASARPAGPVEPGVEPGLRRMRWWDLPEVAALDAELFGAQAWSLATFWSELAGVPDTRHYVVASSAAADGPRLAGYAGLLLSAGSGDVQTLGVAPWARGRGLGRALLAELLAHAAARGASEVLLEVAAGNAAAIALYQSAGFEVIARRRGYYQPSGEDALIMRTRRTGRGAPR